MQEVREALLRVPRYDKSARGGKGDRAPEAEWSVVSTPPDIVLLEGWMLGFEALPDESPLLAAAEQVDGGEQQLPHGGAADASPCGVVLGFTAVLTFFLNTMSLAFCMTLLHNKTRPYISVSPCTSEIPRQAGIQVGGLGAVNTFLKGYQKLHDEVDAWLVLKVSCFLSTSDFYPNVGERVRLGTLRVVQDSRKIIKI